MRLRVLDGAWAPTGPGAAPAGAKGCPGNYLTEINLLLQVSRLLGRLKLRHVEPPEFVLGVLRTDSLATRGTPAASLAVGPKLRKDTAELVEDDIYDVVPVETEKRGAYEELKRDGTFDLVIGNPPYVAEANNKPLFDRLRAIPAWKGTYKGKTDYLYYFLLLAIEKLRPGGTLCVIVPAGWMNAGNADFLRERLASELTLRELYLFGSYRVFAADQGRRRRRPSRAQSSSRRRAPRRRGTSSALWRSRTKARSRG